MFSVHFARVRSAFFVCATATAAIVVVSTTWPIELYVSVCAMLLLLLSCPDARGDDTPNLLKCLYSS